MIALASVFGPGGGGHHVGQGTGPVGAFSRVGIRALRSVRRLLNESRDRPGWDIDARGSTLVILADALATLGDQSGQNAPLQEAVGAYRAALQERTRERVPLQWAMTQNNLGTALGTLGERKSGTQRLEEAVRRPRRRDRAAEGEGRRDDHGDRAVAGEDCPPGGRRPSERGGLNPQRSAERLPAPCSHDRASVSPSRGARLLTDIARMQR